MDDRKPLKVDKSGRINLGKDMAGQLFTLLKEDEKLILEPVRLVSESEFLASRRSRDQILLSEKEWENFELILNDDSPPNEHLKDLMNSDD